MIIVEFLVDLFIGLCNIVSNVVSWIADYWGVGAAIAVIILIKHFAYKK